MGSEDEVTGTVVHTVTTLPPPRQDDSQTRLRTYLVTMAVRTTCFVLMVAIDSWVRWIFVPLAVFLPWIAVSFANATRPRIPTPLDEVPPERPRIVG